MTDYTKLIERLHGVGDQYCHTAADAIEALQADRDQLQRDFTYMKQQRDAYQQAADKMAAEHKAEREALQAENERLKTVVQSWLKANAPNGWIDDLRKERDQLQAENERLKRDVACHDDMSNEIAYLRKERDQLQAKLDELGKQEPVAYVRVSKTGNVTACAESGEFYALPEGAKLYAAPKAQEPSREVIARYMADKGFYLSKEAMDGLMAKLGECGCAPKALEPLTEKALQVARLHFGHAKGYYMGKCLSCAAQMDMVDKRCRVCVDCADKAIAAHGITKATP